jgi:predicted ATPase
MERRRFRSRQDREESAARFAQLLSAALTQLRTTNRALAKVLGVSEHTVNSWTRAAQPKLPSTEHAALLYAWLEHKHAGRGRALAAVVDPDWVPPVLAPAPEPEGSTPSSSGPSSIADPQHTNLPARRTSFVGRAQERIAVRALLANPGLITLWGPAGVGKTRLALEVLAPLVAQFRDGVWLVELASLSSPDLLDQQIAGVWGVRERPHGDRLSSLVEYLQPRHLLLLLDNCEHLRTACAALVSTLLAACPQVTILATSREALHLPGERVWRVPPLSLPDPQPGPGATVAVERLLDYDAVHLFLDRARASLPEFTLTAQNAPAVLQICAQLDGLPLAIELAAAWVRFWPPEILAARLERRLPLLKRDRRSLPARHQTLRLAIAWSHDLLEPEEQILLHRLGVFAGGCTVEAVEVVCHSAAGQELGDLRTGLEALIDQSLLQEERAANGTRRFSLLETIREYALERLAAGEEGGLLRQRHGEYYLALIAQTEGELAGPQQGRVLARLDAERDNLRSALEWVRSTGQAERVLALAMVLTEFWEVRGYLTEGRAQLAVFLAQQAAATSGRARGLIAAGRLAYVQGELLGARLLYEEGLALAQQVEDRGAVATALNGLGGIAWREGNLAGARSASVEALALWRALGDPRGVGWTLENLGDVLARMGDYAGAQSYHEEALRIFRDLDNALGVANILGSLGELAQQESRHPQAIALLEESLSLYQTQGHPQMVAYTLNRLGVSRSAQGEYGAAELLYRQSLAVFEELDLKAEIVEVRANLAKAIQAQGEQP